MASVSPVEGAGTALLSGSPAYLIVPVGGQRVLPRSPEQNNRRPVALTPEVRPRRRRVDFVRVLKVKVDGVASTFWLFTRASICHCAPCCGAPQFCSI